MILLLLGKMDIFIVVGASIKPSHIQDDDLSLSISSFHEEEFWAFRQESQAKDQREYG